MRHISGWIAANTGSTRRYIKIAPDNALKEILSFFPLWSQIFVTAYNSIQLTTNRIHIITINTHAPQQDSEPSIAEGRGKSRRLQFVVSSHESCRCKALSTEAFMQNKNTAADAIGCRFIMSRNSFYALDEYFSPP